jgi:hypothetical protein
MIRRFFAAAIILSISINAFCFRNFKENSDYLLEFNEKPHKMASVLHIKFITIIPEPLEAAEIVKQYLEIYGNKLAGEKSSEHKNIIGSVWYMDEKSKEFVKIKFQKDLGAYVWIGKTKKIVTFPNYMAFLKKARKNRIVQAKKSLKMQQQMQNQ